MDCAEPADRGERSGTGAARAEKALTPAVFHLLLALADGPLHGYAILQAARLNSGPGPPMGPSTVYGTLQRLLDLAWVEECPTDAGTTDDVDVAESERSGPGRPRRYFAMTEAGREALEREGRRLVRLAELVRQRDLLPGLGR